MPADTRRIDIFRAVFRVLSTECARLGSISMRDERAPFQFDLLVSTQAECPNRCNHVGDRISIYGARSHCQRPVLRKAKSVWASTQRTQRTQRNRAREFYLSMRRHLTWELSRRLRAIRFAMTLPTQPT